MKGFEEVKSKLNAIPEKMLEAGKKGVKETTDNIFRESQSLVPYDTGALHDSWNEQEKSSARKYSVILSYNTDYALYIHEVASLAHPNGGTAKYLETPFMKYGMDMERVITSYLRGIL